MKIHLRELSRRDLPTLNIWRNDHDIIDFLGNNFLFIANEIDEKWYESYLQNRVSAVRLAIADEESDTLVGTVQLTGIHQINRSAEFSISIGNKAYWSKGVGFIAASQILKHAFNDLNLYRIHLTVLSDNHRAIKLYEKLGFKTEGLLRGAVFKNGVFKDLITMSLLKEF